MKNILFLFFLSISIQASELQLIGKALLEYSIFKIDVYEISYFKGPNGVEELVLDYKVDVKRKHSIEGWKVGLEPILKEKPEYKEKAQWIMDQTVDLKDGDRFTIRKNKTETILLKNNKEVARSQDKVVSLLAFEPWIGKKPIDEEIKNKLLKNI